MTLHDTTESMKKATIGGGIGIAAIILLVILFRGAILVKNIIFPPKVEPPNHAYDILPAIQFPENAVAQNLTYSLNTLTGTFPVFPDRLNVFPITQPQPNLLNLDKAKEKAKEIDFINQAGHVLPERALGNSVYQWTENSGIKRIFTINTITFNFDLTSDYLTSITVLTGQHISDQKNAIDTASDFLRDMLLYPDDIASEKTDNPNPTAPYFTYPQLFSIVNGQLSPTTSLSKTQIIRVDFYQKDIEYDLNTGRTDDEHVLQRTHMQLPVLYPRPPYSTMSFWIGSGDSQARVVQSKFIHQQIETPEEEATYALKTAEEAFEELKNGQAYIAAYNGADTQILIEDVYLAYYLGEEQQQYLMPIYVFEGQDGFFAYASAIADEWVQ